MESFGGPGMVVVGNGVRKKRTDSSRKPRHDSNTLLQSNIAFPGSTQILVNSTKSQDEDHNDGDNKVVVVVSDGLRKLKKLKLKVGGVTRTIHTKPKPDFGTETGSSSIAFKAQQNPILLEELDKTKGLGVKFKNLPKPDSISQTEQVRKSNRVPKRRVLDIGFEEDEDDQNDDEIRFLERLKNPKTRPDTQDFYGRKRERVVFKAIPKSPVVLDLLYDETVGKKSKPKSKSKSDDIDYVEEEDEEEKIVDEERGSSRKKLKKESTPTTRSMQSISGSVELLNLLPINSKRKKEKLSEVEQQLKKAEAAQRRKMQSEKAAREAEAEAIRKILGQDSVRKKKEEKMKKQRDELLQERAANFHTLPANTVRWVNGPTGTIVTFSQDIGLPSIFNPAPCSYPPAREKCAGPNCTNSYKYRDAKSNLPLCSLRCYKSIVERNVQHHLVTC